MWLQLHSNIAQDYSDYKKEKTLENNRPAIWTFMLWQASIIVDVIPVDYLNCIAWACFTNGLLAGALVLLDASVISVWYWIQLFVGTHNIGRFWWKTRRQLANRTSGTAITVLSEYHITFSGASITGG